MQGDMSATRTVRVMLMEDYSAFREILTFALEHTPNLEVVAQAGSLAEAREALDRRLDVAVVDLGLPDGDGSELFGDLRRTNPGISVLVLTAAIEPGLDGNLAKAGADAHPVRSCLDPSARCDDLQIRAGHIYPGAKIHLPQHIYEFKPVSVGQLVVEERNVHTFKHRVCLSKRSSRTHHLKVRLLLQQAGQGTPEADMIVYH
jgi:CheY-like chemotaxis protein